MAYVPPALSMVNFDLLPYEPVSLAAVDFALGGGEPQGEFVLVGMIRITAGGLSAGPSVPDWICLAAVLERAMSPETALRGAVSVEAVLTLGQRHGVAVCRSVQVDLRLCQVVEVAVER